MTDIARAHKSLERFCRAVDDSTPGVAIGQEIFGHLVKKAISLANQHTSVRYPTTNEFEGMQIAFAGRISVDDDPTSPHPFQVELDRGATPPGGSPRPELKLVNVSFTVSVELDGVLMSEHTILYSEIVGGVDVKETAISLFGERSDGSWTSASRPWESMTRLPDGTTFTPSLKEDWKVQERAIQMIAKDTLGPMLVQSVEVPNLLSMLEGFRFVGPVRVGGARELVMFSGPAEWVEGCPRRPARGKAAISSTYDDGTVSAQPQGSDEYGDPGDDYENSSAGDVFVFLPRKFVEKRFDGIARPAAGFVDSGHVGPIRWHYEAAVAPDGADVTMVGLWPLEFRLDVPSTAFGSAGAGVKIGCVYVEAAGAAFDGRIDPFEFLFKIGLNFKAGEVFFDSRFGQVRARDFQFHQWPSIGFPIDQIASFVLSRVAEMLISVRTNRVLNRTRFTLVDFQLVRGFGRMLPHFAAERSTDGAAVTVGVTFDKAVP